MVLSQVLWVCGGFPPCRQFYGMRGKWVDSARNRDPKRFENSYPKRSTTIPGQFQKSQHKVHKQIQQASNSLEKCYLGSRWDNFVYNEKCCICFTKEVMFDRAIFIVCVPVRPLCVRPLCWGSRARIINFPSAGLRRA